MFNIEQSPFLHALGYAIGHSLWQMSLLWLVYIGVIYLNQWTSTQRYNLAVTAATTGFVWFIATLIYYNNHITIDQQNLLVETIPANERLFSPSGNFVFFYHSALATLRSLAPYFSCAYLVVMMLLSIRLANGFNEVKKLKTEGLSKASVDWRMFVKEHAALLGIKKPVLLYVSNIAASPLTIGFWKPFILIPLASINQLTPQQLEAVLLHELAHIRRNDYLLNIVLQVTEITLFFNPFMRLLLKQARLERENCCDDYVLQFQYNATDYAKALLAIEQHSVESILALGTNNQNEFQLLNRIKRMLAPERKAFNYKQQLGLLFIITILGLGFTVISPKQQADKTPPIAKVGFTKNGQLNASLHEIQLPPAIDLVKNIEQIQHQIGQKIALATANVKSKKLEAAIATATNDLNLQVKPAIREIRNSEIELEKLSNDVARYSEAMELNAWKWNDLNKVEWDKILVPAIDEVVKAYAFPEGFASGEKWPMAIIPEAPPVPPAPPAVKTDLAMEKLMRAQQIKMLKLQERMNVEQKKIVRMSRMQAMIADSIQLLFTSPAIVNNLSYSASIARARKQAAIAPYRQRENTINTSGPAKTSNFKFNYSYQDVDEEENDDNQDVIKINGIEDEKTRIADHCECPTSQKPKIKTVMVFNGKVISEKIKKSLVEARLNIDNDWPEEMKEEAVREIEKGLRSIGHFEIKTHVITKPGSNNKTITIEVETL